MYKIFIVSLLSCFVMPGAFAGFIDSRDQGHSDKPEAAAPRLPSAMPAAPGSGRAPGVGAPAPVMDGPAVKQMDAALGGRPVVKADELKPLVLLPGSRLSHSIRDWLAGRSIKLSWEAQGKTPGLVRDFEVESQWTSRSADLEASLTEVLSPFGLTAEILRAPGAPAGTAEMVMIRNGAAPRP